MSTKNFVPRANNEGGIGTEAKQWGSVWSKNMYVDGTNVKNKLTTLEQDVAAVNIELASKAIVFNNVESMKASNLAIGATALTTGYHNPNDGGAGVYNIRVCGSGEPESCDNGSTISLTNGNIAELIHKNTVNVKQFGAYGNGTTTDDTAFQNIATYASAKNLIMLVPPATYKVTATITGTFGTFGDVTIIGGGTVNIVNLKDVADDAQDSADAAATSESNALSYRNAAQSSAAAAAASASDADTTATALTTWLADKETLTAPAVDPTLTISGAAADAKVTGDILNPLVNPPYTWTDDKFITEFGVESDNTNYSVATIIGEYSYLYIETYIGANVSIAFYDDNNVCINAYAKFGALSLFADSIKTPFGTVKTKISCQKSNKSNFVVKALPAQLYKGINDTLAQKVDLPYQRDDVSYTINQGLVNKNLTIYNPGGTYTGRYTVIDVNPYETYMVSGYSTSYQYYCAMTVDANDNILPALAGTAVTYNDAIIQIPYGAVKLYVNGYVNAPISIKKLTRISQDEFLLLIGAKPLKMIFSGTSLKVKKKYDATHDICIEFGNVGGNGLWNFKDIFYIANSGEYVNDDFTYDVPSWSMTVSDWIGPYTVAAVNNIDGDNPTSGYFTGGNHRTTNGAEGGGVTAIQQSISVLVDGVFVPTQGQIYSCNKVVVKWTNAVQAYNTSKADGSGRAVLTETWEMVIDSQKVKLRNTIKALEPIVLSKYYGLQATCRGKSFKYIGGTNRADYTIGTDVNNSGNNTCRTVVLWNADFNCEITVDAVDLGLFAHNIGSSFFSSNSKMYASLVSPDNAINIDTGEQYYVEGSYTFN